MKELIHGWWLAFDWENKKECRARWTAASSQNRLKIENEETRSILMRSRLKTFPMLFVVSRNWPLSASWLASFYCWMFELIWPFFFFCWLPLSLSTLQRLHVLQPSSSACKDKRWLSLSIEEYRFFVMRLFPNAYFLFSLLFLFPSLLLLFVCWLPLRTKRTNMDRQSHLFTLPLMRVTWMLTYRSTSWFRRDGHVSPCSDLFRCEPTKTRRCSTSR